MRKILLALGLMIAAGPVVAQDSVVVELYTSQGCSSCPPADRIFAGIVGQDNVIALALHVDYWDYLGWKDEFASPAFSARQRRYARSWSERSVYTPQIVVQGVEYMVGSRGDQVQRQIMNYENQPEQVALDVSVDSGNALINIQPEGNGLGASTVYLVRYGLGEDVQILRGENAGRNIHYVNTVESWDKISDWDGHSAIAMRTNNLQSGNYVVIVQKAGQGRIYAAHAFAL